MSASLVGSEMCIRDRVRESASPRVRESANPRIRESASPRVRESASPRAVSYTHLTLPTICSV
eukprot:1834028-Alexandrium_andersonii.AAC.1